MVRVGSPPESQRPTAAGLFWLLPTVPSVAAAAVAVALVEGDARIPLAVSLVCAVAAVALAAAEATRRGRRIAAQRQHHAAEFADLQARHAAEAAALQRHLAAQEAALVQLTEKLLPTTIRRLQSGETAQEVLYGIADDADITKEFASAQFDVLKTAAEAVEAEEGMRDAAQRAFVNIARRVQAIVHQQATDLREMEERHGTNPDVFGDLLRIDHGTALIGRLADSIAVLGGARPGRQWQNNVALYSVLRGATSRITDYPRIELTSIAEVAVIGPAVEPLIHALAELLDNATRYSPPKTMVRVSASEVQSGIAIEIEDGGIGLADEARRRVERLLEEAHAGLDLADLGESPRLGLAVVGRLAQAYNLTVALRPSAYGGVRAILVVPKELIAAAPKSIISSAAPGIGALPAARSQKSYGSALPNLASRGDETPSDMVGRTANGLPQRQRRARAVPPRAGGRANGTATAPPVPRQATTPPPAQPATATEPGLWLDAFSKGVSGEPAAAKSPEKTRDDLLDKGDRDAETS
ncbi:ATP-binding protein [Yinghuangia sp. ASG 101]|uniref:sensor histidine kinase n=1 Tax=Yinghuangia sp. ASG 101 TaxID=2896848 RepID=UPI001E45973E|nr:ATP-binding protein [Yinghuangia sp. ASG 101]UGQ15295.1 ATP-binding protein [Yinghuangia sp. ASG 101]